MKLCGIFNAIKLDKKMNLTRLECVCPRNTYLYIKLVFVYNSVVRQSKHKKKTTKKPGKRREKKQKYIYIHVSNGTRNEPSDDESA